MAYDRLWEIAISRQWFDRLSGNWARWHVL